MSMESGLFQKVDGENNDQGEQSARQRTYMSLS